MSPSRPKPPEAVGDTDILVSGAGAFVRPASLSEPIETELLRRWLNEDWVWETSEPLLAEYEEILLRGGAPLARVQPHSCPNQGPSADCNAASRGDTSPRPRGRSRHWDRTG